MNISIQPAIIPPQKKTTLGALHLYSKNIKNATVIPMHKMIKEIIIAKSGIALNIFNTLTYIV